MNDRIRTLRISLGLNQSEFSNKIGIGQAALSAIEKGIRNVTDRNIQLICSTFNVNENWLRDGEGEMFDQLSDDEETIALIADLCSTGNKYKIAALRAAARIIDDDACWNIIETELRKLIDPTKKE